VAVDPHLTEETSPTSRALMALELIHDRPGVSGEALARRLGVSTRAARRYVGILREAGIPVESTSGRYGGYRVGRGFRVPPLMFSTEQALALVMAAVRGRHAVGGTGAVDEALDKIVRVLPAAAAQPVEALRQVRSPRDEPGGPDPALASRLVRAAQDGVRVRLSYRTHPERPARQMDVDPWGVALRHDRWYLLGWSHTAEATRVLRLDRVEAVTDTEHRFDPPAGLDVADAVDEHLSEGWGEQVSVVVDAPPELVACWLPRHLGRREPIDGGARTRVLASTENPDWYARQLARLEAPYRIEGPDALKEACRRLGELVVRAAGPP
jgi:predicted DNA-binding transcriptional regulator YafY